MSLFADLLLCRAVCDAAWRRMRGFHVRKSRPNQPRGRTCHSPAPETHAHPRAIVPSPTAIPAATPWPRVPAALPCSRPTAWCSVLELCCAQPVKRPDPSLTPAHALARQRPFLRRRFR